MIKCYISIDMSAIMSVFILTQHTEFDLHSASSLKQQSAGRHVAQLGHIILIQTNTNFIAIDFSGAQTHDIPYTRRVG